MFMECVQIKSLKAPGNYSDQFWSKKISALLCEGPKPNISMFSGFVNPWEPLVMDSIILEYFENIGKLWKHFKKICLHTSGLPFFVNFGKDGHR